MTISMMQPTLLMISDDIADPKRKRCAGAIAPAFSIKKRSLIATVNIMGVVPACDDDLVDHDVKQGTEGQQVIY